MLRDSWSDAYEEVDPPTPASNARQDFTDSLDDNYVYASSCVVLPQNTVSSRERNSIQAQQQENYYSFQYGGGRLYDDECSSEAEDEHEGEEREISPKDLYGSGASRTVYAHYYLEGEDARGASSCDEIEEDDKSSDDEEEAESGERPRNPSQLHASE